MLKSRFSLLRLAELDFAVTQKLDPEVAENLEYQQPKRKGRSRYNLAKKYFDVKEYSRFNKFIICALNLNVTHHSYLIF